MQTKKLSGKHAVSFTVLHHLHKNEAPNDYCILY